MVSQWLRGFGLVACALAVWAVFPPAIGAQSQAELAVRGVVERSNHDQEGAMIGKDWSILNATMTDEMATEFRQMMEFSTFLGLMSAQMDEIEWGPVRVSGDSATATTYETWTNVTTEGTEQSRARNDYLLRLVNGAWKIEAVRQIPAD